MAEEKITANDTGAPMGMSRDDMSALEYVLSHVKGSSPSSATSLTIDDVSFE